MDAYSINEKLVRLYGRDTIYNQPNFRLVWSDSLIEKKEETYEDYTPEGIYLGTKKGIREKKKYWYLKPCWVLEKFFRVDTTKIELATSVREALYTELETPFTYENLVTFLDKDNNNLPLTWEPIEFAINAYNMVEHSYRDHVELVKKREQQQIAEEEKKTRDILEESDPIDPLTFKSAVLVGEKYNERDSN